MILNCIDNKVTFNKKNYLERAAARLGIKFEDDGCVLNIEPYQFVKGKKWTGIWEIDLLLDHEGMQEKNWEQADVIFIAISTLPPRLERFRHKTVLLFQACDPELHKRTSEPSYDVILSGTLDGEPYRERRRIYDLIAEHCKFGNLGKDNKPAQYVDLLSKANIQFIRSMKTPIGEGEIAQRFFECLAIGPVLTNHVKDLEHTGLVEEEDYLAYRDDEEMLMKLKWLLDKPKFAQEMAENGRKKALLYHTYENRLMTIIHYANQF